MWNGKQDNWKRFIAFFVNLRIVPTIMQSRPLVWAIVLICAYAGLRWLLKFSSVIAYYLVIFVFYINNLGN